MLYSLFQIDVNMGYTEFNSRNVFIFNNEYIEILPCILKGFKNGNVKGLFGKNSYKIDFSWKDGKIIDFNVKFKINKKVKIYVNHTLKNLYKTN